MKDYVKSILQYNSEAYIFNNLFLASINNLCLTNLKAFSLNAFIPSHTLPIIKYQLHHQLPPIGHHLLFSIHPRVEDYGVQIVFNSIIYYPHSSAFIEPYSILDYSRIAAPHPRDCMKHASLIG